MVVANEVCIPSDHVPSPVGELTTTDPTTRLTNTGGPCCGQLAVGGQGWQRKLESALPEFRRTWLTPKGAHRTRVTWSRHSKGFVVARQARTAHNARRIRALLPRRTRNALLSLRVEFDYKVVRRAALQKETRTNLDPYGPWSPCLHGGIPETQ
eukprot:2521525-Rhodomonas_salina.5